MYQFFIAITATLLTGSVWGQDMTLQEVYKNHLSAYVAHSEASNQLSPRTRGYYTGTCEVRSGKADVAIGFDANNDGSYDAFFGIQTHDSYQLKRQAEGCELIYLGELILYRSLADGFIAVLALNAFERAQEPWAEVPREIKVKIDDQQYFGYGVHNHHGEGYTFDDFGK